VVFLCAAILLLTRISEVSVDILARLINAASYIPSGGNSHSHEFTVLKDARVTKELKEELTNIYRMRSAVIRNPLLRKLACFFSNRQTREFLNDKTYRKRMEELIDRIFTGDDPIFYNAPAIIIIHSGKQIPVYMQLLLSDSRQQITTGLPQGLLRK